MRYKASYSVFSNALKKFQLKEDLKYPMLCICFFNFIFFLLFIYESFDYFTNSQSYSFLLYHFNIDHTTTHLDKIIQSSGSCFSGVFTSTRESCISDAGWEEGGSTDVVTSFLTEISDAGSEKGSLGPSSES